MIIFGTANRESVRDRGTFLCPRCNAQRSYQLKSVDRYFSLYFIPLIPMGSAGTYIQCDSCAGTFAEEVLTYDPELEHQESMERIKRLLVMALLAANRTGSQYVARLQEAYAKLTDIVLQDDEIAGEVSMAQQAGVDPVQFYRQEADELSEEGKVIVLKAAHDMFSPAGPVGPEEEQILRQLGKAMGMPKKHIATVLSFGQEE